MIAGHAETRPIRVLLVDDHALVREALRTMIDDEPDLSVCGMAATAAECRLALARLAPDLIVLDLSLRDCDGTRLLREITTGPHACRVLVLSAYEESAYAERCLHAGASGYVNKQAAADDVRQAIRNVAQGQVQRSECAALGQVARSGSRSRVPDDRGPGSLSDRELELFQLLGRGFGPSEIARELGLSIKTVEGYESRIRIKLRLENSTALSRFAVGWYRGVTR
jgi:DNA-binding NarL/FixJ family response regulator